MRRAAEQYRQRGELGWALQLLVASGDAAEAATVLAGTPPEVAEAMDILELEAVFDQLPGDAVDANPNVLLLVARGLRVATRWDRGRALLDRAREIADRSPDTVLGRAVAVELAAESLRELNPQPAEDAVRSVLRDAAPGERLTRARANHILGQAMCWRLDSAGRRDESALAEAEECFSRASNLYQSLGMRSATSALIPYWAVSIEFARGQAADAMERLEKGLNLVADLPRRWAYLMCFRAWVAAELGQDEVCRTSAEEALRVGEQLDSRGDLDGVRRMVERTIEFAPYDDLRYLHAATTLLEQGRRGEALSVVHRARSAFAEIGLEPPRPLLELERSIVA